MKSNPAQQPVLETMLSLDIESLLKNEGEIEGPLVVFFNSDATTCCLLSSLWKESLSGLIVKGGL